ncbi:hypothetical protein ACLB2K_046204 [Fragaria x ananassa]
MHARCEPCFATLTSPRLTPISSACYRAGIGTCGLFIDVHRRLSAADLYIIQRGIGTPDDRRNFPLTGSKSKCTTSSTSKSYRHSEEIVNVGRGAVIDEKELVRCLMHGEIRGAGLDVFEDEPHVPKVLFGLDNVVLSPHTAAFTPQSFQTENDVMVANLEAFFSDQPLVTPFIDD